MKMNLCFSTLGCCDRSLDEIFALCARYGFSSLEIRGIGGVLDNRLIPEFGENRIEETLGRFKNAGVSPLVLGTSCLFHDAEKFDGAVEEGKAAVMTAASLGACAIRVFGNNLGENPQISTERVIDGIGRILKTADENGIDVLLEVHGDFNTIEALSPVAEAIKTEKHFGLIWDICHTHRPYGENWLEFYNAFRPYIKHVHIKDIKADKLVLPGEGEIPIKSIVSQLLADGYGGAFSLEWEKKWHPELCEIEDAIAAFLRQIDI